MNDVNVNDVKVCSFCGKTYEDVKKMLVNEVCCICNECIGVALENVTADNDLDIFGEISAQVLEFFIDYARFRFGCNGDFSLDQARSRLNDIRLLDKEIKNIESAIQTIQNNILETTSQKEVISIMYEVARLTEAKVHSEYKRGIILKEISG